MSNPRNGHDDVAATRYSRDERTVHTGPAGHDGDDIGATAVTSERHAVLQREKERHGGIKWGSAFFGWLTATGYCGGYVAGRMARLSGAKQGIGVWIWSIVIAVVVAVVGALAGAEFDILAELGGFPRLPINEGDVTTGGIIAIVVAVVAALVGAVLGGLAGMRYHRKVDKAGLGL
ncbi:hypothetical protein AB0C12_34830 [Actinoplanes sp. NPDC048967]|uniref:hypothetical protein n=1 Tax=Actinoplanes sp. NPDC048967 TaxID=3155269 RepID=UPI0033EC0247